MPANESPRESGKPLAPCPTWCVHNHDEDSDTSRRHVSRGVLIPGIALAARHGGIDDSRSGGASSSVGLTGAVTKLPNGERTIGVTISTALHSQDGSPLNWIYVGDGGSIGGDISTETAWLLIEALKELLEEMAQ